jgi:hypothetical protein
MDPIKVTPMAPAPLLLPAHVVEERRAERAERAQPAAGRQLMAFQRAARKWTGVFIPNTGGGLLRKPPQTFAAPARQRPAPGERLAKLSIGGNGQVQARQEPVAVAGDGNPAAPAPAPYKADGSGRHRWTA